MYKVKANQEQSAQPKEEKKSVFQMASDSSEPEEQEEQEEQEEPEQIEQEVPDQEGNEEQEEQEQNADDLIARLENNEELSDEELEFLKSEGLIEMEEVPEFVAPSDLETLQGYFPGRKFDSPEDVEQARTELYEKYNEEIEGRKALTQQVQEITNTLNGSDELKDIVKAIQNGRSLRAAILEAGFSASDFEVQEGDEDEEDMIEAKVNAREKQRQKQKQEEEFKANYAQSTQVIESLEYQPEQKQQVLDKLNKTFQDMTKGIVTKETIEMFAKALNHDSEIEKAEQRAERRIKNQKITILKQKKKGDSQPRIVSRQTRKSTPKQDPFFSNLTKNVIARSTRFSDRAKGEA